MDDVRLSPAQTEHLERLHRAVRERTARQLTASDAKVLRWRAPVATGGEGLTYAQIAARLGVHRSRAHQIVVAATRRQKLLGVELQPWQRDLLARSFEQLPDGTLRAKKLVLIQPRKRS